MSLLDKLPSQRLTPARIWTELDAATREEAARALYDRSWTDASSRAEADASIAVALRFRHEAVRRLPQDKRVRYLVQAVRPSESLASALLMALHLVGRNEMLAAFLDALGIPQKDGLIDEEHELGRVERERLEAGLVVLRQRFPAERVDLYLASLIAIDPVVWGGLVELLAPAQG
jgi:hypothetical protein